MNNCLTHFSEKYFNASNYIFNPESSLLFSKKVSCPQKDKDPRR